MKKIIRIMLYCIATVVFTVGLSILYYYYPRKVSFELTKEIDKPYSDFDRTYYVGFNHVENKKHLMWYMIDIYKAIYPPSRQEQGYDSIFVENLGKELDFNKYDYIITYQKQLKELTYSPYLANNFDDCRFMDEKPLFPTFDTAITDKVYIYQIKKNKKYRPPCP
jgi:hypothetical protein